jgi:hypothetical protein
MMEMINDKNMEVWKAKAIERRLINKELGKRKKELIKSRDSWKAKCFLERQRAYDLDKELVRIKKNLKRIIIGR